jgi:hypothetical protein
LKFNEVVNGYSEQKQRLRHLEEKVVVLNHEKSVAISKLQLVGANSPMRSSFRGSVLSNNTPIIKV